MFYTFVFTRILPDSSGKNKGDNFSCDFKLCRTYRFTLISAIRRNDIEISKPT